MSHLSAPPGAPGKLPRPRLFARASRREAARVAGVLRTETAGGVLLVVAAVTAVAWANSPAADSYRALRDHVVGPASLHLDLSLGTWAADGLLAIFFFVAGLELKRELVAGDLRDPQRAALPVAAAVGGMAVPALVFVAVASFGGDGALRGWAVPTATDIAFAVAVLALVNTHLPSGLRTFLLALAVVDDLLAITVIALFYSDAVHLMPLLGGLLAVAAFGVLIRFDLPRLLLALPLALTAWAAVHASGVHATVAGVLLAFTVPVVRGDDPDVPRVPGAPGAHGDDLAARWEHLWRPISAGVAVPVFALLAAGVGVGGAAGLRSAVTDPVAVGIVLGLLVGKVVGIVGSTWLLARFTRAELDDELAWSDVAGMGVLAGIGFTVSLLIGELAFGPGTVLDEHAKVGVLLGSTLSAAVGVALLCRRNRVYRRLCAAEQADAVA